MDTKRSFAVLDRGDFQSLFDVLVSRGYTLYGPSLQDNAIVLDRIEGAADLPVGWLDEQGPGKYRLKRDEYDSLFRYVVGPQSWKKFLYPSEAPLLTLDRSGRGFRASAGGGSGSERAALIGVRSCDLNAILIQDKILAAGPFVDRDYVRRREGRFIVAVNCARAGEQCFCVSMGTGPKAAGGFDLALTEIVDRERHWFLIEAGSSSGAEVLSELPVREASGAECEEAGEAVARAAAHMGKGLETDGLRELLDGFFDHPHWEEIAGRCLTCGNCTLVCPTCFCTDIIDDTDISGERAWRRRQWDSCFSVDFAYIYGGSLRATAAARYRQWMTHKLGYWHDQFGMSGCVGCGRCITWCPVGIDITEEAAYFRNIQKRLAEARTEE